jgi:hypothetical protein
MEWIKVLTASETYHKQRTAHSWHLPVNKKDVLGSVMQHLAQIQNTTKIKIVDTQKRAE